jgi:DNA replication protein DnaC
MEVLFHFLAERCEKKTVITSDLVFSQWDQVSKNPMAAIDRLVHGATILEFTGESIRANAAKKRQS